MNNVYHQSGLSYRFEAVHWRDDSAVCIMTPDTIRRDKARRNGRRTAGWRIVMTLEAGLPREAASRLARRLNEARA